MSSSLPPTTAGPAVPEHLPDFAAVVAAQDRIAPFVIRTPVLRSAAFEARIGQAVFLKCENLQHGGAFKFRGAIKALLQLPAGERIDTVATHSSGNHGTALALAARARGIACIVVMPEDSSATKFDAVRAAGAEIVTSSPGTVAREAKLAEVLQTRRAHVVHPFDDARIIAGQGTAALELLCEQPQLDCIVAPVGGGGLIGGTALACKGVSTAIRVVGAEPAQADDAARSFASGVRQSAGVPHTIADGLRGSIGVRNFELLRAKVDDVVTVSEAEIVAAMRIVLADFKLLIEPSSAVAVAALLAGRVGAHGRQLGIIISGGNVDLAQCPFLSGKVS